MNPRVEPLAKQLYNVFKSTAIKADRFADGTVEEWEDVEAEFQEIFRAQAKYVLSTYTENDRLRAENARLKEEVKNLHQTQEDQREFYLNELER